MTLFNFTIKELLILVSGHSIPMYMQLDEMSLEPLMIRLPGPSHEYLFRRTLDWVLPGFFETANRLPGSEWGIGILNPRHVIGTPPSLLQIDYILYRQTIL